MALTPFTRITTFLVGDLPHEFRIHTDLLVRTSTRFQRDRSLQSSEPITVPLVRPTVFALLVTFLHGEDLNREWKEPVHQLELTELAILANDLGTLSLQHHIAGIIFEEARVTGPTRVCPNLSALLKAYSEEYTDETFFLRHLYADFYAYGSHRALDPLSGSIALKRTSFWDEYSHKCQLRRERWSIARQIGRPMPSKWTLVQYFPRSPLPLHPSMVPAKKTHSGPMIGTNSLLRVKRICIDDGKAPLLIHESLSSEWDTEALRASGPREVRYERGWRGAVIIYLQWLYHSRACWKTDNLTDLILAYCLDLPGHNHSSHFKNAVISAIVSWCSRYALVPSDGDIVLAYQKTQPGSPLRKFLAGWIITHPTNTPVNFPTLPDHVRVQLETDLANEVHERTLDAQLDASKKTLYPDWYFSHANNWRGESCVNELNLRSPYYHDLVCVRFHEHDLRNPRVPVREGMECQDFDAPEDKLPYVVAYLPPSVARDRREGWPAHTFTPPAVMREDCWTGNSDPGRLAYHARMLLGNSAWSCAHCPGGRAYFYRDMQSGFTDYTIVDPRMVDWVRGGDCTYGATYWEAPDAVIGLAQWDLDEFE
ncbi:hypothetical protein JOL62DRAFT_555886 [Phyllosticta paracitricarpa]|uniref:BTB domain-containing protein n=2 Tax=Phyllosticta TaxID=121621 RepID=A0ABR1MKQ7_9PEZI